MQGLLARYSSMLALIRIFQGVSLTLVRKFEDIGSSALFTS
jgi:hypothetical protein